MTQVEKKMEVALTADSAMMSVIQGVMILDTACRISEMAMNRKPFIFSMIKPEEMDPAMKATDLQMKMVDITCADVPVISWRSGRTGPMMLRFKPCKRERTYIMYVNMFSSHWAYKMIFFVHILQHTFLS